MQLTILVATMTGTAEMVADEMEQALGDAGHEVDVKMMDDLDVSVFAAGGAFIICTSTYGFGNVPDNAIEFLEKLEAAHPDLSDVRYGVFALGDHTYSDTFCHGGTRFDELLTKLGAHRVGDIRQHDASSTELPEEVAPGWALEWVMQLEAAGAAAEPN